MTTTVSKRKRYVREITPSWWKKLDFYKLYILREGTSVPTLWFCLELLYALTCLGSVDQIKQDLIPFLQNPVVIIFNLITLAAMILNTVTYYFMTPKVLNIVVKNERLNPNIITIGLWVATAIVSIILLILMYV
ncbi:MAG: fumarate reductase subunit FrdC [Pasteurellaceae bacterium]|nr:fumarate reductase subunit FrdC [Pasteurellaceae bacterium]